VITRSGYKHCSAEKEARMNSRAIVPLSVVIVIGACGPTPVDLGPREDRPTEQVIDAAVLDAGPGSAGGSSPGPGAGGAGGSSPGPGAGGAGGSDPGPGTGGSAGLPGGSSCLGERIESETCADNSVLLGRGYERCSAQGRNLRTISYLHPCDDYTSSVAHVLCCDSSGGSIDAGSSIDATPGAGGAGGSTPGPNPGDGLTCLGEWIEHPACVNNSTLLPSSYALCASRGLEFGKITFVATCDGEAWWKAHVSCCE
jgi:hypothetical protein